MAFPLTEEQRAVVEHRNGALLVSAAAGSGKTRVLVERLLSRVEQGLDIDRFLVITFTNAAAAELRGRIGEALTARLARNPGGAHLRRQSLRLYQAHICTIDALCIDLLRQYGHLLDVDPDWRVCDQAEGEELARQVLEELLEEKYQEMDGGFRALAEYAFHGRDDRRLEQMLLDIRDRVQSCPDPARWLEEHREDLSVPGITDAAGTPWGALILDHVRVQAAYWRGQMAKALTLAARDPVTDCNYGPSLSATLDGLERLCQAKGWEECCACFPIPFPRAGSKKGADPAVKEPVAALRKRCQKGLDRLEERLGYDSTTALEQLRQLSPVVETLLDLVREFDRRLFQEKSRRGLLEFSDVEHLCVRLLEREAVRAEVGERFAEILVDEYQDTNQVQNALFDALSDGGRNLIFVGDVKQSIYRFRQADPTIFLQKYRDWPSAARAGEGQPRKLLLTRNFRSRPQVLWAVNDVFSRIMSPDCGEMEYGEQERLSWDEDAPLDPACAVELDALALPARSQGEEAAHPSLLEARFVARRLGQMLREGFPVSDGAGGRRPMEPEDAVILLRSPGPVLRYYVQALAEEGIPLEAEGDGDFFETTEISVALSLLQVIDNPRQDVPLISLLRSPVFGFSSDRLAQIRAGCREGDFYDALLADGGEDCAAFLERLKLLRFRAGETSAHRLLERLYRETDMMAIFGAMPDGRRRQANLDALAGQARLLERSGHRGLYAFLRHLERLREQGRTVNAARGGGGMKLLSVHRSKGLEFPVVFLCGLARQFNQMDEKAPLLFHPRLGVGPRRLERGEGWTVEWPTLARQALGLAMNREMKAEEMRLLYVAMTRAKEKLILTMGLSRWEKKLAALAGDAGCPPEPEVVAAAPSPGDWLLLCALTRPEAGALRRENGCPVDGEGRGPEWEIHLLPGEDYEAAALARPAAPAEPERVEPERVERLAQAMRWTYPYLYAAQLPSNLTATQLKGRNLDAEAAEETAAPRPAAPPAFARPDFAARALGLTASQRGTALHKVLQYLDYDRTGSLEEISGEIERLVREEYMTQEEARSASPQKLLNFFTSPLGRRLLRAPVRQREYKFSLLRPAREFFPQAGEEEILFQGVVDCWFEDEGGITVVDFKTDHRPEPEQYRPQVEAYAKALELLLGRPVARKALYFFSTGLTVLLGENPQ